MTSSTAPGDSRTSACAATALRRVRELLPRGGTLPESSWNRRHRALLAVLWVHVPALFVYGTLRGKGAAHSLAETLIVAAIAMAATQVRHGRVLRSSLVALGLMTASALVVHFSDGMIEAHFHFFVMVIALTLYQDWVPFLLAIGFVAIHHGVMGALDPGSVYNHPEAVAHPWLWGLIHATYILAASAAGVVSWRLSEADLRARLDQAEGEKLRDLTLLQEAAHLLASTVDRRDIHASTARLAALITSSVAASRHAAVYRMDDDATTLMAEYGDDQAGSGSPTAVAPVTVQGIPSAVIVVSGSDGVAVTDAERRALEGIAELTGLALSRAATEDALRDSEQKFRELFERNPQPMLVYDRNTLRFLAANQASVAHYGYTRKEFAGMSLHSLMAPGTMPEPADVVGCWERAAESPHEARHRLKDGRLIDVQVHTRHQEFDGRDAGLAVIVDVTEQRALESQLRHQALHDPLTGLANRVLFHDRVEHARARGEQQSRPFAVLLLDLDNFKRVNDSLGHAAGDQLLDAVATRIISCLRPGDTAARLGGDEFAVLLEDLASPGEADDVATRLLAALRAPFHVDEREVFIGASIGVVWSEADQASPDRMLRDADLAMYSAKAQGKGRHVLFESSMHDAVLDRASLENDLRRAVERGELRLVYQPQIDLRSGQMVGVEALVRWVHPVRGLIPPDRFIPIAEETGLIREIDGWVLDAACAQARHWLDAGLSPVRMAVNASGRHFDDGSLVEEVSDCLRRHALPRGVVEIELTERVAVQHERAAETVARLQSMGVGVSIDDFGTGYSMLSTLRHVPGDRLKIDKGFIDDIGEGGEREALVGAIIAMGHGLGLQVVAEGVETAEQAAFLRRHECDESQGYFFSRPVDAHTVEQTMRRSRTVATLEAPTEADPARFAVAPR